MMLHRISFVLFLVPAVLAVAQECHINTMSNTNNDTLTVFDPSDLSVLTNCSTIVGDIVIESTFTGIFVLNGVTNFTGSISIADDSVEMQSFNGFEMLDLLYIERIYLPKSWRLARLVLPRVQHLEQLYFVQAAETGWLDVGSLESAESISITGAWTNISFPSLETVSRDLTIVTDPSWSLSNKPNPLDIDLPALKQAHWVSIRGYVSSLSTPNLEVLGAPDGPDPRGMEVRAEYRNVSLVDLSSVSELYGELLLDGHFTRINLNGMQQANATITVRAASPVEIYYGLRDAGDIDLSGVLTVIAFEDIRSTTEITLISTVVNNWPPSLIQVYRAMNYPYEPTFCTRSSLSDAEKPSNLPTADDPVFQDSATSSSVPNLVTREVSFPTFTSSVSDRKTGPRVPTAIIVMLPAIVGFSIMAGLWCCFARRKPREKRIWLGA